MIDTPYNRAIRAKILSIDRKYIDHSRRYNVGTQEKLYNPLVRGGRMQEVFESLTGSGIDYVDSLVGDGVEEVDKSELHGGYMGEAARPVNVAPQRIDGSHPLLEGAGLEEKEEVVAEDRAKGKKPRITMRRGGANLSGVPTPAHLEGGANLAGVPTPAHLEGGVFEPLYGRKFGDPLYGFSPGIVGLGKKKVIKMKPADFMKEHKDIVGLLGSTGKELSKEAKSQLSEMKAQQKKLKKMKGGDLADAMNVVRNPLTGYGEHNEEELRGGFLGSLLPFLPTIIGAIAGRGKLGKREMSRLEKQGLHERLRGGFDLSSLLQFAPLVLGLGKKKRLMKADMQKLQGSGLFDLVGSILGFGATSGGEKPKIFYANGKEQQGAGIFGDIGSVVDGIGSLIGIGKSAKKGLKKGGRQIGGIKSSAELSGQLTEKSQLPAVVGGGKRQARANLVKKIMKERGVSLAEASSIVKRENMKY